MQKVYFFFLFSILLFFSGCNTDPDYEDNTAFKQLSRNEDFKRAHEDPAEIGKLPLTGEMIEFKVSKGNKTSAYLVKASKPTKNWLIVYHEWWGLNGYIKKESDHLANELKNVNILALDLYDGKIATTADDASKLVNETSDKRIEQIIQDALGYIGDTCKIATIGWCFGGGWSLQTAIVAGKQDIGCVMYYGMPEKDMAKINKIECPVLGIFAKRDKGITPKLVEEFQTKMNYSQKPLRVKYYDADHAFANPSNPHFNREAAAEANNIVIAFLKDRYQTSK